MTPPLSYGDLVQVMDRSRVMCACFEMAGTLIYCTEAYAEHAGATREELVGKHFREFVTADSLDNVLAHVPELHRGNAASYTRHFVTANGDKRTVEITLRPLRLDDRAVLVSTVVDISAHRRASDEQRAMLQRMQKFFEATHEGIMFHAHGRILDVNPALLSMLGYESESVVGRHILELVPDAYHARVMPAPGETKLPPEPREAVVLARDGREVPIEFIVRDMEWRGATQRMVIVRDLTERKRAEQHVRHLALHDSLTGLPNRAHLEQHLAELIRQAEVNHRLFAVLFIDLDHLKRINDSLGHAVGDSVLQAIANTLSTFCAAQSSRQSQLWAARLGGDEFVLTCNATQRAEIEALVEHVERLFDEPVRLNTREFTVTASIGVAVFPEDGATAALLLRHADAAMYAAKSAGRDNVRYFDQALALAAEQALVIEQELAQALERGEFRLYYQPEIDAATDQLVSMEVLLRWQHPARGLVSPDSFMPVAEGLRLIQPISNWVLESALAQLERWQRTDLPVPRMSVNLSDHLIASSRAVDDLLARIAHYQLPPTSVELELTERLLMRRNPALVNDLHRLRAVGIRLAIDDFGTGLSSLSRLRSLPFDTIKIDRSFVADLPTSSSAVAVVEAIMDLTRGLFVDAVAEGVETEAQRECLLACGCRTMQGYLLAPPMPADEFERWLRARTSSSKGKS